MTPQERLDYLLEVVIAPSNRGRLTHTWVAENVSLAVADGVYAAINSVSVPSALRYVTGNGIDTSAELWKMQATGVAAVNESLAPYLLLLRDFELIYQPRWQVEGYNEEPTFELIEAELQAKAISDWTESKVQQVSAAMRLAAAADGATIESVRAAATAELS
jgi:hypothetical protein